MTPEQRLDRAERVLKMMARAGRRTRSQFREDINILIQTQMETGEIMKRVAVSQAELAQAQAELAEAQKLTEKELHAFIVSLRKRENGNSSN